MNYICIKMCIIRGGTSLSILGPLMLKLCQDWTVTIMMTQLGESLQPHLFAAMGIEKIDGIAYFTIN